MSKESIGAKAFIMKNKSGYYWIVVAMALVATSLSFLDRQVLAILIIKIKQER